jgi:hypothetical protein
VSKHLFDQSFHTSGSLIPATPKTKRFSHVMPTGPTPYRLPATQMRNTPLLATETPHRMKLRDLLQPVQECSSFFKDPKNFEIPEKELDVSSSTHKKSPVNYGHFICQSFTIDDGVQDSIQNESIKISTQQGSESEPKVVKIDTKKLAGTI